MYPKVCLYGFLLAFGLHRSRASPDLIEEKRLFTENRPIWSREVNGSWQCGASYHFSVLCANDSDVIKIPRCYCMFYDEKARQTQLGYCLTTCFHIDRTPYITLKRYLVDNGSQFNRDMCSEEVASFVTNKMGRFCGRCKKGFGFDANTQHLSRCIPCKIQHRLTNWVKYFAITLIPLTVFYFIVVISKISITNSKLNGIIFNIQIMLSSVLLELMLYTWIDTSTSNVSNVISAIKAIKLFFEFVNLNFFRDFYPTICLGPNFSPLEVVALDYITAIFPFFLILFSYILIRLYDRNVTILVLAWKPFKCCLDYFYANMAPRTSLVETFASFILLSSVKILATSLTILSYVDIYDELGRTVKKRYLYIDASIEFFGSEHLPFAFLALTVCSIFVIVPFLLQLLYPSMWFQKCLNYCGWNFQVLHVFMDAFQGSYRTEPYDMRSFSSFYIFARLLFLLLLSFIHNYLQVWIFYVVASVLLGIIVAIAQPYRVSSHNNLDIVTTLMSILPGIAVILFTFILFFDHRLRYGTAVMFGFTLTIVSLYWMVILSWGLLGDHLKVLYRKVHGKLRACIYHGTLTDVVGNRMNFYEDQNSNECSNLL